MNESNDGAAADGELTAEEQALFEEIAEIHEFEDDEIAAFLDVVLQSDSPESSTEDAN